MKDTVRVGTAKNLADALTDIGWSIGGKTGTKIREGQPATEADGCFAGLIFDHRGQPRFTVMTFVRHGGYGGGSSAGISAMVARLLARDAD
jgi:cell division protein FtsI/penicillin-binding protein 2